MCHEAALGEAVRLRAVVSRGATGWHLPVLVLASGLLVGSLLIFLGDRASRPESAPDAMPAKVVDTAPCGPVDARDTVQVMVHGRSERLVLDGCGNPVGTELEVELWRDGAVRVAGTGMPASGLAERLSMLLFVLAGFAGALLTLVLPRRRDPARVLTPSDSV